MYCQTGCSCPSCALRFRDFGEKLKRGDSQIIVISDGLALTNEFIGGVPSELIFGVRIATFESAHKSTLPRWGQPSG